MSIHIVTLPIWIDNLLNLMLFPLVIILPMMGACFYSYWAWFVRKDSVKRRIMLERCRRAISIKRAFRQWASEFKRN